VRSFIEKDEWNMVNYFSQSKLLASVIKKFFTKSMIEKKMKLIENGEIKPDSLMEGWTEK